MEQDAHAALDNFWQSVDAEDAKKTHPLSKTVAPAVATGVERNAAASHAHASGGAREHGQVRESTLASPQAHTGSSKQAVQERGESGEAEGKGGGAEEVKREGSTEGGGAGGSGARVGTSAMAAQTRVAAASQTLASSVSSSSSASPAGGKSSFLGLPSGKAPAVAIPRHQMTSHESNQKLDGYFSGVRA